MERSNGRSLEDLKNIFLLCQEFKVKHFKDQQLEFTMDEKSFVKQLNDQEIKILMNEQRKAIDQEQRDFEKTLYYSSDTAL